MDNINKKKEFIIKFIYFLIILGIIFFIFKYALPLLSPFIFAFLISMALKRPVDYISTKFKINRKIIGVIMLLFVYICICMILIFFGTKIFQYIGGIFQKLPDIYTFNVEPALNIIIYKIQDIIPEITNFINLEDINKYIMNIVNLISLSAVDAIASIATKIPSFLVKFIFAIISSFLFTLDYYRFTGFVMRQFPERIQHIILNIKRNIFGTIFRLIKAYSILLTLTFIELSIGLTIFNIPNSILLAIVIAILDILPAIGVGGILIPWAVIELMKGNYNLAIGLIVIYAIITIIRYILEPKIVGNQIGLNPIVTIISMFLGAQLLGFLGIFILPIIVTIIKYLNDTGTIKVFK